MSMPFDLPPIEIHADASQQSVLAQVNQAIPDGMPGNDVGDALRRQGFNCTLNRKKLVCRLERKKNLVTKEAWILAFDLDEHGRITEKRVKHGFIAP